MADTTYNDDLLIRYLDGELPSDEKAAVEERLKTEPQLNEQLTRLRVAVQAVRHAGAEEAVKSVHAEMMRELKAERPAKVVSLRKAVRYLMAVAASAAVLFVGVRLYQASRLTPEKVYSQTFVDFNVSASRNAGSGLSEIEKRYQQKQYAAVTGSQRSFTLCAKDSLLVGLAYLHTAHTAQAVGFFNGLASTPNEFRQDAEFYLSLSHLKNKNYAAALALMQKIADDPSHLYRERITADVLEKVKKLNGR